MSDFDISVGLLGGSSTGAGTSGGLILEQLVAILTNIEQSGKASVTITANLEQLKEQLASLSNTALTLNTTHFEGAAKQIAESSKGIQAATAKSSSEAEQSVKKLATEEAAAHTQKMRRLARLQGRQTSDHKTIMNQLIETEKRESSAHKLRMNQKAEETQSELDKSRIESAANDSKFKQERVAGQVIANQTKALTLQSKQQSEMYKSAGLNVKTYGELLQTLGTEITGVGDKFDNIAFDTTDNRAQRLGATINDLKTGFANLGNLKVGSRDSVELVSSLRSSLVGVKKELSLIQSENVLSDKQEQSVEKLRTNVGKLASNFSVLGSKITGVRDSRILTSETVSQLDAFKEQAEEAAPLLRQMFDSENVESYGDTIAQLSEKYFIMKNAVSEATAASAASKNQATNMFADNNALSSSYIKLTDYMSKWEVQLRAQPSLYLNGIKLQKEFAQGTNGMYKTQEEATAALNSFTMQCQDAGIQTESLTERLGRMFTRHIPTMITLGALMAMQNGLQVVWQGTLDVNEAMTQLKIITSQSADVYNKFGDEVIAVSKRIGAAVSDVIDTTTTFARLGFTLWDSLDLSEMTSVYSKVADVEPMDAQSNITALIKAFDLDITEVKGVLDKLVNIGNHFPISAGELGEGMQNAAAALVAAGNTMDEAIAILTAANQVVQDASRSSTAVRTITARIRNSKADLEELGESFDEASNATSKYRTQLLALSGVDILQGDGTTFKSTYQILDEISARWGTLRDTSKAAIADILGGVRQYSIVSSMLDGWSTAQDALNTSLDSTGSLADAQNKWMESLQAHFNQLKTAFVEIGQNPVITDMAMGLIDGLTSLFNVVNNLTTALGGLGGALLKIGANMLVLSTLGKKIGSIMPQGKLTPSSGMLYMLTSDFGTTVDKSTELVARLKTNATQLDAVGMAMNKTWGSATAKMMKFQLAGAGVAAAISVIAAVIRAVKQANDEVIKATAEASESFESESDQIARLVSSYKELAEVENPTESTREAIRSVQEQITDLVGEEAANLNLVNGGLSTQLELLKGIQNTRQDDYLTENYTGYNKAIGRLNRGGNSQLDLSYLSTFQELGISTSELDSPELGFVISSENIIEQIAYLNEAKQLLIDQNAPVARIAKITDIIAKLESDYSDELASANGYLTVMAQKLLPEIMDEDLTAKLAEGGEGGVQALEAYLDKIESSNEVIEYGGEQLAKGYERAFADALRKVAYEYFPNLPTAIKESTDIVISNQQTTVKNLVDSLDAYEEKLKSLQTAYQALESDGSVDAGDLSTLIEQYSELAPVVQEYIQGLITQEEFMGRLQDAADEEALATENALQLKLMMQDEYTLALADAYGVDLTNYATVEEAKLAICNSVIGTSLDINDANVAEMAKAYGVDLSNYKTMSEKKVAIAKAFINTEIGTLKTTLAQARQTGDSAYAQQLVRLIGQYSEQSRKLDAVSKISATYSVKKPNSSLSKGLSSKSGGGGNSTASTDDEYLDKVKSYIAEIKYMYDRGIISEEQYYAELRTINDQYFKDKEKYLDEYRDYELEVYKYLQKQEEERIEKLKDDMSTTQSAVVSLLDEEIEKLKSANEENEKAVEIEQAKQDLANAKTQRKLIYRAGVGFVYDTDITEVKKAQQALKDIIEEDELTKKIEALEEYRDMWDSIDDDYEDAQNRLIASQSLGADWEGEILDQRLNKLAEFRNRYIALQNEMSGIPAGDTSSLFPNGKLSFTGASYASGTSSSVGGWSRINELGTELLVGKRGTYAYLQAGSGVIPATITARLLEIATAPSSFFAKYSKTLGGGITSVTVNGGDIVIQGNADGNLIPIIKKVVTEENNKLSRQISKLIYSNK